MTAKQLRTLVLGDKVTVIWKKGMAPRKGIFIEVKKYGNRVLGAVKVGRMIGEYRASQITLVSKVPRAKELAKLVKKFISDAEKLIG